VNITQIMSNKMIKKKAKKKNAEPPPKNIIAVTLVQKQKSTRNSHIQEQYP